MYVCSIIIPCYNEAERLEINTFINFAKKTSIHLVFVDDGSTDKTFDVLNKAELNYEEIEILRLTKNCGKGEAVRQGMLHALKNEEVKYIGFIDADLAIPLEELYSMYNLLRDTNYPFYAITGLRLKRLGSEVNRPFFRHILGRIIATFISVILDLPTYDTQCGVKVFNRSLTNIISQEPFISKWFFDVEMIFRIKKFLGKKDTINRIYEYPLLACIEDKNGSKLRFKHYLLAPYELLRIMRNYRRGSS